MTEAIIVITACANREQAKRIADELLIRKLAGCVQMTAVISSYRWKGSIVNDDECLVLIKSVRRHYKNIERCITELHDYEIPEILSFSVQESLPAYLQWLASECDDSS